MTTTAKAPSRRRPEQAGPWPPSPWVAPPLTTEEHLKRIEALAERIAGYIRFMGQVGTMNGTSAEMKERAVAAFYERLTLAESQLGRIREDLRLD
jgi:hypothetical protein